MENERKPNALDYFVCFTLFLGLLLEQALWFDLNDEFFTTQQRRFCNLNFSFLFVYFVPIRRNFAILENFPHQLFMNFQF